MSDQNALVDQKTFADDVSHDFINIVEADEHKNQLTRELLEACTKNFTKPVLFRGMVPLDQKVQTREFLEVETDQKLLWREKDSDEAVAFRGKDGKTDYNYVSGAEGTAKEYLDAIFEDKKDVYAHLGKVSSGFENLDRYPWGVTLFEHIKQEVFRKDWFQVPGWELSGHCFLGNNTEMFAEPSSGAPGSDWHMFPTLNLFVMLAGQKRWMSRPPQVGDQHRNQEELVFPTGGREGPVEDREFDTVYVNPGDVLFNLPYEWHKVVNAQGWSLGTAFRVLDQAYIERLLNFPAIKTNLKPKGLNDDYGHMATSLHYASYDPIRMQMSLNTAEIMVVTAARFNVLK